MSKILSKGTTYCGKNSFFLRDLLILLFYGIIVYELCLQNVLNNIYL